jgi:gliding motility-associated-like protein
MSNTKIRYALPCFLPRFALRCLAILWICARCSNALNGQNPCPNPVPAPSITVINATCGNSTGGIVINFTGGNQGYKFDWTPEATSKTNSAFDIPAGVYRIRIARTNNANCKLDTTVIVNNSNGPTVSVVGLEGAKCSAANGKIAFSPSSLGYNWANGLSGPIQEKLPSGCYIVTATNTNGCSVILRTCVPSENSLALNAVVTRPAKCGKANGEALLSVSGGSGDYTFAPGGSPAFKNLAAGVQTLTVTDKADGCVSKTDVTIPGVTAKAQIQLTTYNVKCNGDKDGFVVFTVKPGENFELPYVFSLKNSAGATASPGNLAPGLYDLQVFDADNCPVPAASFIIVEPPPLKIQTAVGARTCDKPGELKLSVSGGNGAYITDWADLPGSNDGNDRLNVGPGLYSAVIYDSLFCSTRLDSVLVADNCARPDTLYRYLSVNARDTFCLETPSGIARTAIDYRLRNGLSSGSSPYGVYALTKDGCLAYTSRNGTGFGVDTILVNAKSRPGLDASYCIIVSITAKPPERDTVDFTVQAGAEVGVCGEIPAGFTNNRRIVPLEGGRFSGASGSYGAYSINPANACLTFKAAKQPGFNIDDICVGVYDLTLKQAYIVCYRPSVLPLVDCASYNIFKDTLLLNAPNCALPAAGCVPIPFARIIDYVVLDNGAAYTGGYQGCSEENQVSYNIADLPAGSPFFLENWNIDGQTQTGNFAHGAGLVVLMNQLDPEGRWAIRQEKFIVGGNPKTTYGPIKVSSLQGTAATLNPGVQLVPAGTNLRFMPGFHRVTFRHITTGCVDTALVRVGCGDCPPVHTYPTGNGGVIAWEVSNCAKDTLFCTTIPANLQNRYRFTDNGRSFSSFFPCNNFVGMKLDTGFHDIRIVDAEDRCSYNIRFKLDCRDDALNSVRFLNMAEGTTQTVCLDTLLIPGPLTSASNACPKSADGNVVWNFGNRNTCLRLQAALEGSDTLCTRVCNARGSCILTTFIVNVLGDDAGFLARPDVVNTPRNQPAGISILGNDLYTGAVTVDFLNFPANGQITFNAASAILNYRPDPDFCGVDSIRYRIKNAAGTESVARVTINVYCDRVLVFNGISPNGDGVNDTWTLPGIEKFPNNEVRVYNRWGNLVYRQKAYSNQNPWDGRWNGADLPDGPYYYIIELDALSEALSGYLQIMR